MINNLLTFASVMKSIGGVLLAVVILLSNILLGIGLMNKKDEERTTVRVAAIQGNVDMDASRRVSFRFIINLGE